MSEPHNPDPLKPTDPPRRMIPGPYVFGLGRFVRCLPAVVPVVLFLSIAWLDFGSGFNIPATFWAGGWGTGLSVTLLFAYLFLVAYVLDATHDPQLLCDAAAPRGWHTRLAMWTFPERAKKSDGRATRIRAYMAVTFLPSVAGLALATGFRFGEQWPYVFVRTSDPYEDGAKLLFSVRWPVLAGVAVGVCALWVAHVVGSMLAGPWAWLGKRSGLLARLTERDRAVNRGVAVGLFAVQFMLFMACAWVVRNGWDVRDEAWRWYPQPVTAVCVLFGVLAGVSAFVWYHARRVALPAFVVLVGWLYYSNSEPYRLRFPNLDAEYADRVRLTDHDGPAGTWAGIGPDEERQTKEWGRVLNLVRVRLKMVGGPPEYVGKWNELNGRFDDWKKLPPDSPERGAGEQAYRELVELYVGAIDKAELDELKVLEAWKAATLRREPGKPKPKLAVVTVTGGANRSALWTATVLSELHKLPAFPRHVRLVTGASGGMVGAAYYAGSLADGGVLPEGFSPADVAQDHIVPIMSSLVFHEVPRLALPRPYTHDRGHALDLSLEGRGPHLGPAGRRLGGAFDRTFASLRAGEEEGWRPPLVYTPMMIEDGRRLFISNRHTQYLTTSTGNILLNDDPPAGDEPAHDMPASELAVSQSRSAKQLPPPCPETVVRRWERLPWGREKRTATLDVYGRSGVEFFQLFPEARGRFKVSTGARMNATFPYLSPAVELPTDPPRRVVDAGFYDNYGVGVASGWLHFWRKWLAENTSGVIVIQIRDSASHYDRRHLTRMAEQRDGQGADGAGAGGRRVSVSPVGWLTGPLAAVDKARQSTSSFRNDDLLAALDDYFKLHPATGGDHEFFETVVFERYSNVGMSWFLNDEDKRQIKASWEDPLPHGAANENPKSLSKLEKWWKSR